MYSLLLERPLTLFLCWVGAQFALICIWSWRRTSLTARTAMAGFLAVPILLGLSIFVVTSAEEVIAECHKLAAAVDDGDMKVIARGVAAEFATAGLTRDEFLNRIEQSLTRVRVDRPRLSSFNVNAPNNQAVAEFTATFRIRSEEVTLEALPTRWRVAFRRQGDDWLITSIESIPTPPLNLRSLDDWLR